jgi:uncharacterized protein YeaO (DUF488 family)
VSPTINQLRQNFGVGAPARYEEMLERFAEQLLAENAKFAHMLKQPEQKRLTK